MDRSSTSTLLSLLQSPGLGAGAGGGGVLVVTVTVVLALLLPPAPLQERLKVELEFIEITCVPLVALAPLQAPLAVQVVALVELQLIVELDPALMVVGLAEIETVGAGLVLVVTDRAVLWLLSLPALS
jgi:hypothetical protein